MTCDHDIDPKVPGEGWSSSRLLWICPFLGLFAGAAVLWIFGVTLWTALVLVFLVACPLVVAWVLVIEPGRRPFWRKAP